MKRMLVIHVLEDGAIRCVWIMAASVQEAVEEEQSDHPIIVLEEDAIDTLRSFLEIGE